jgi:hypothetical protein
MAGVLEPLHSYVQNTDLFHEPWLLSPVSGALEIYFSLNLSQFAVLFFETTQSYSTSPRKTWWVASEYANGIK